jgi:hypothetical protein
MSTQRLVARAGLLVKSQTSAFLTRNVLAHENQTALRLGDRCLALDEVGLQ